MAYQAARLTPSLNLEAFKTEIARALGPDDLLAAIGDWLGVLLHLANKAESHPGLVILLDEFPYLIDAEPALPSIIQKFWDAGAPQRGRLKLVLYGSLIAHMRTCSPNAIRSMGAKPWHSSWDSCHCATA